MRFRLKSDGRTQGIAIKNYLASKEYPGKEKEQLG
jgi:hypothetical protein